MTGGRYPHRPVTIDGQTFASGREAARYAELRLLERAGLVAGLELHPAFVLQPAFTDPRGRRHRAIGYTADFSYVDTATGRRIVEEVKSSGTRQERAYSIRVRLFAHRYPELEHRETT